MALDSRYQLAPSLEMYFVDKDSGLPLVNGRVYFFEDDARSIPKPVYKLTGSPPNYGYDVLPNPSILSSVGTFQDDDGNDILPYYYPFDDNGNVQLYYIEVYDEDGALQFTREGWPNFTAADVTADQDVTNFVPNGQFLLHNDIPASTANSFVAGKISQAVTEIAQGGWTFERSSPSTAIDIVTFIRYGSAISAPTGNPRYAVQIATTQAGSDTRKDLCLKFRDVNTFASDTQQYNLYFEAESGTGSNISNVQIIIRKFFGVGGSATSESVVTSVTILPSLQSFNIPILFGTNGGDTIGPDDDDYVQICIRLPPTGVQTAILTDFALTVNDEILTAFPQQTEAQQIAPSTAGWLPAPNPDGSDLYLPLRLTKSGLQYDDSVVASITASLVSTPGIGELLCDGTQYRSDDYSSDGIPYARLQAKLFNGTVPRYGTGSNFVTGIVSTGATQNVLYSTNTFGNAIAPLDGAVTTGFTFTSVHAPSTLGYGERAYQAGSALVYVRSTTNGSVTAPAAATSGFTITDIRNIAAVSTAHIFSIQTVAASAIAAGSYFTFSSLNPGATNYYMWFKKDGAGADPAPGGTGIEVDLLSNMTAQDVAVLVAAALNGGRQYVITCTAASAITTGSYFTFGTPNSSNYYVWYRKDGAGTDPNPPGATLGVRVDILTADSNATVASKTVVALNSAYFAVPNFQGMFLRGIDPNSTWDFETATRFGMVPNVFGNTIGTFEFDQNLSHLHTATSNSSSSSTGTVDLQGGGDFEHNTTITFGSNRTGSHIYNLSISTSTTTTTTIAANGGQEANPVNANVYWMIKY